MSAVQPLMARLTSCSWVQSSTGSAMAVVASNAVVKQVAIESPRVRRNTVDRDVTSKDLRFIYADQLNTLEARMKFCLQLGFITKGIPLVGMSSGAKSSRKK
jgi:hypothetical protein